MTWLDEFDRRLDGLSKDNLTRTRRIVRPETGPRLNVNGRSMLAFCSNDYLGLSAHPALKAAARTAVDTYGVGSGGSPMVSGYSAANAALEAELAAFVELPRALYFYAGYATNVSILPALVGPGDVIFSDTLNHASLIDGARLSKASIRPYPHNDLAALAGQLAGEVAPRKLILTDAVFSMDGDIARLRGLLELADRHDALLLLDDAHGFGVLGAHGRGALAAAGLTGAAASPRVLYMATLSKALGVAGAFVAGPDRLVEWLLQKTRSYTYATAAPAMLAEALREALRIVGGREGDRLRSQLAERIAELRQGLAAGAHGAMDAAGWRLTPSETAIQPLIIGDNASALKVMAGLHEAGLWVPAMRPPTVPAGTARLRIALSAAHGPEDVARLVNTLGRLAEV